MDGEGRDMRGISNKWPQYYSDVENKLRAQGIDITDYDEDEHVWPDYRDGISADECAQHIIDDWTGPMEYAE